MPLKKEIGFYYPMFIFLYLIYKMLKIFSTNTVYIRSILTLDYSSLQILIRSSLLLCYKEVSLLIRSHHLELKKQWKGYTTKISILKSLTQKKPKLNRKLSLKKMKCLNLRKSYGVYVGCILLSLREENLVVSVGIMLMIGMIQI